MRKGERLENAGAADVLLLGDSTAYFGLDAKALGAGFEGTAYNGAIISGSPILARFLYSRVTHAPRRIVFAFTPRTLGDAWPSEPHEQHHSSFDERVQLLGAGPAVLGTAWVSYGRRDALYQLLVGGRRADGPNDGEDAFGSYGVEAATRPDLAGARGQYMRFRAAPGQARGVRALAMEELAQRWHEMGADVTYVTMPMSSFLRATMEEDNALQPSLTWVKDLAGKTSAHFLDCSAAVDDDGFYDPEHMRIGPLRTSFSNSLGRALRVRSASCARPGN